jgi:hypothetical protein
VDNISLKTLIADQGRSEIGASMSRFATYLENQPVKLNEKVYDRCARCQRSRYRAILFWWRSLNETLCSKYYTAGDWSEVMSQGYDNVRTLKQLRALKSNLMRRNSRSNSSTKQALTDSIEGRPDSLRRTSLRFASVCQYTNFQHISP